MSGKDSGLLRICSVNMRELGLALMLRVHAWLELVA